MSIETVKDVVEWLDTIGSSQVTITFHGGEPLLAGAEFYKEALPLLAGGLRRLKPAFALQTNLWRLTPELADILAEYDVPLGSSIDGPQAINDSQRGTGYYEKTMRGYEIAREHGLRVSFICTFTASSVRRKEEIFDFFQKKGITLKLHPALPSLRDGNAQDWALSPEAYGELLVYLLEKNLEHLGRITIMNINDLCTCIFTRRGTVCTFADCMGSTFAVGPDGSIYPCYRFIGMPEFVMGNVADHPSMDDLASSDAWRLMQGYKEYVDRACAGCAHIRYCRGGCPYNAIAATGGGIGGVDPMCAAYKRIFTEIADRLDQEMFSGPDLDGFQQAPSRTAKPGIMALMRTIISR